MLKIFVEGKGDIQFMEDLIELKLGKKKNIDFEVNKTDGWNNLKKGIPKIKSLNDEGHRVQIIFDADSDHQERRRAIEKIRSDNHLDFDMFLFPDNSSNGNLETLLESIINDNHRRVLDCFQKHEDCLEQYKDDEKAYALPIKKSKIYAYVDAFPKSNDELKAFKQNKDYFYKNQEIWNLNSEKLDPLIDFLNRGIAP